MTKKEKTYWYDLKPSDDNKGFIYGINYIDGDEVIECEWFKTKQERNKKYMTKKDNDPFGFNKAINWDKLDDPKVMKELEELFNEEEEKDDE